MSVLLDTHVLIWWFQDRSRLSKAQRRVLDRADPESPLLLSDISLWELATLHELRRIRFKLPLREWLEKATAPPLVERIGITPAVAAEVAALPSTFQRDPADRIIISTARVMGVKLLTQDEEILSSGLVEAIP